MNADYNSHPTLGIIAVLMWFFGPPSINNNCDCWHSLKVVSTTFSNFPFLFAGLKHSLWQLSFDFLGDGVGCIAFQAFTFSNASLLWMSLLLSHTNLHIIQLSVQWFDDDLTFRHYRGVESRSWGGIILVCLKFLCNISGFIPVGCLCWVLGCCTSSNCCMQFCIWTWHK